MLAVGAIDFFKGLTSPAVFVSAATILKLLTYTVITVAASVITTSMSSLYKVEDSTPPYSLPESVS